MNNIVKKNGYLCIIDPLMHRTIITHPFQKEEIPISIQSIFFYELFV